MRDKVYGAAKESDDAKDVTKIVMGWRKQIS